MEQTTEDDRDEQSDAETSFEGPTNTEGFGVFVWMFLAVGALLIGIVWLAIRFAPHFTH